MAISGVMVVVIGLVIVVLAALAVLASMFRKVGPNQALIIYGLGGTRVVKGGGAVVLPKTDIGVHGFIATVRDTEGNVVGLHSERRA